MDAALIDLLQADPGVELDYHPVSDEAALIQRIGGAEVLVTRYHNGVTARVLDAAPDLKLIVQGTSGTDNIDFATAERRGIRVVALPGENANAVAEWVIGAMIALTRTVPAYTRQVRQGIWQREDCATRRELRSHQLGIVGIGRVGSLVAAHARSFGMSPLAYDPYLSAEEVARRGGHKMESFEELLARTEILTLHVPLTEETRRMVGSVQLETLPAGAIVINACRGPVVDEAAVLHALASNHLGGVALDVFEEEPPRREWPDDPRLILSPHVAGCSRESKESIAREIYTRIREYL